MKRWREKGSGVRCIGNKGVRAKCVSESFFDCFFLATSEDESDDVDSTEEGECVGFSVRDRIYSLHRQKRAWLFARVREAPGRRMCWLTLCELVRRVPKAAAADNGALKRHAAHHKPNTRFEKLQVDPASDSTTAVMTVIWPRHLLPHLLLP